MPGTPAAALNSCIDQMLSSPNRTFTNADALYKVLARSGDFSKPENHCEQVGEVNQFAVTMYYGASKV